MTVSIIIPHWNRHELLLSLLDSIQQQKLPDGVDLETLVVDNGSTDQSAGVARGLGARVLRLSQNEGVSRALNRGIRATDGEVVVLLNNDVELAPDWLGHLLGAMKDDNIWFATGKTLDFEDRRLIDGAGDAMCRGGASWRLGHGKDDGPAFASRRRTFFPSATATAFRRSFFDRVGLLEEEFFAYLEDADLGLRAAIEKLPGVYVPEAVAYHRGGATSGVWSSQTVEWMTCHQLLLIAKFYPVGMISRYAHAILAAQLLWTVLAISRGRGGAWLRGFALGIWRFSRVRRASKQVRGKAGRLASVLSEAEADIFRVQKATSWDSYWKWYFRFVNPPAENRA